MRAALLLLSIAACKPYYNDGLLPRSGPLIGWAKLRAIDHDESSYTQGLVYADGFLYESAGGERKSRILKSDASSGKRVAQVKWPTAIAGTTQPPFAEGLALDGDRLVQLSWKNQRALTWTRDLKRGPDLGYNGDGWGLCFDGSGYWRSDGSARLHRHARDTFAEERTVTVRSRGVEVRSLNELECIGEYVYANVWHTPYVVIIRASDGVVVGVLDFSRLVDDAGASGRESVLNGLAWDAARGELYVTGKRWPKTYVVRVNPPGRSRSRTRSRARGTGTRASGSRRC